MAQGGNVTLHISLNGSYHPALSIPSREFPYFSVHPLKWLRYVAYTIYGAEGSISTSADGGEIPDYNAPLQHTQYYFRSNNDPLWLDPSAMDDRTTSASSSTRHDGFRSQVGTRDGKCIMTEIIQHVDAAHIIPHSKGNNYIAKLHPYRRVPLQPPLDDINDVRNGLFLFRGLHAFFGSSAIAFLRTPNFAMATTDVPTIGLDPGPLASRLTMQCVDENTRLLHLHMGGPDACHNSDAQLDLQSPDSPPPLLFDIAYGCAILKAWAERGFLESLDTSTAWFYSNDEDAIDDKNPGPMDDDSKDSDHADDDNGNNKFRSPTPRDHSHISGTSLKGAKQQKQVRRGKDKQSRGDDRTIQEMLIAFWLLNAKKRMTQEHAEVSGSSAVREKVEHWRQAVE